MAVLKKVRGTNFKRIEMTLEERLIKEMCWGPMWDTYDKCVIGLQGLPERYLTSVVFTLPSATPTLAIIDKLITDSMYEALISPCECVRYRAYQLYVSSK